MLYPVLLLNAFVLIGLMFRRGGTFKGMDGIFRSVQCSPGDCRSINEGNVTAETSKSNYHSLLSRHLSERLSRLLRDTGCLLHLKWKIVPTFLLLFGLFSPSAYCSADVAGSDEIVLTDAETAWLKQNHTVRVRVGEWPPFMFSEGKVEGIAIEYLEHIFKQHNISYSYIISKEVSWKDALNFIREHREVDMVPTVKITEERKTFMGFSDEYLFLPWVIFTRSDYQFVSSIDDMAGKSVCVPDGYVMHTILQSGYPDINLHIVSGVNTAKQCLQLLSSGSIDGFVGNLAVGTYLIQSQGFNNIKVAAPTPFGSHNQAMGVRNDWPELVSIINKTLKTFGPEDHSEIRNKWLSVRYEHGLQPFDIIRWVAAVAAVFLCIVGSIMYWNRKLNKEISVRREFEGLLRESEGKYRSLSDAAFEGIAILENDEIIEVNNRLMEIVGYDVHELVGASVANFLEVDERDKVLKRLAGGQEELYETKILRKDGSTIPVEVQSKHFSYQGGNVRVSAIRDISQRKNAEAELKILRGILPLCSFCKKVRDDDGYWQQVDVYIHRHSEADISHSLCPECAEKHYSQHIK